MPVNALPQTHQRLVDDAPRCSARRLCSSLSASHASLSQEGEGGLDAEKEENKEKSEESPSLLPYFAIDFNVALNSIEIERGETAEP